MTHELLVVYTPPDEQEFPERRLQEGELLVVGRVQGPEGLELFDAASSISRSAVGLSLERSGVRIKNLNRFVSIEVGEVGSLGQSLQMGAVIELPGDCWVLIGEERHRLDLEVLGVLPIDTRRSGLGPETTTGPIQRAWERLHPNYRQVCTGLAVSWFVHDLRDISPASVPTNHQLAMLLGVTVPAVNNKLDRTKNRLGEMLDRDFIGEQGKLQIALLVTDSPLVTESDVLQLPGLSSLARRSDS